MDQIFLFASDVENENCKRDSRDNMTIGVSSSREKRNAAHTALREIHVRFFSREIAVLATYSLYALLLIIRVNEHLRASVTELSRRRSSRDYKYAWH